MASYEDIANIMLHILLMAIFIMVYFFTYGVYLEQEIAKKQVNDITSDFIRDIKTVTPTLAPILQTHFSNIIYPNLSEEDKLAAQRNKTLRNRAVIFISGFALVLFMVIVYLVTTYNINITDIIITNIISFVVVALTYFVFATYIVANYKSVDTNFIKKSFVQTLVDYAKK